MGILIVKGGIMPLFEKKCKEKLLNVRQESGFVLLCSLVPARGKREI